MSVVFCQVSRGLWIKMEILVITSNKILEVFIKKKSLDKAKKI